MDLILLSTLDSDLLGTEAILLDSKSMEAAQQEALEIYVKHIAPVMNWEELQDGLRPTEWFEVVECKNARNFK